MTHIDLVQARNFLRQQENNSPRKLRRQIGGAALFLLLGGGYAFYHAQANPAPQAVPAAAPVAVQALRPQTVKPFAEFSGRIDAVDYAEIRPQVAGRITEVRFKDGQQVKAGDVLFVIDPRPYQAAAAKATGDLASAINNARLAKIERDRGERLIKAQALAQESFDQRDTADSVAQAAVKSAQAALAAAQVDVDHAFIKAPISGRISRAEITVGNLVGSPTAAPQLLASIVSDNGVYADFEVDEQTYLNTVRNHAQTQDQLQAIPVDLTVQGDSQAKLYRGTIESFDNRINAGSGTIRARARFANEDGALVPGMFVSVRMGGATLDNRLLVPETAIGSDQSKRFVFVVGAGDKAEYREVALGSTVDGNRVVTSGLKPGDRVILDGLQKLAPGAAVAPQPVKTAAN
ncbi:MAG TPA: efflux RND transporter periplasmic adaptor subunit [Rhizomicrobium sp.]|nr:efflux RND transporter periplasmic adaptor subunit [Rhizomicrobium sp.]